MKKQIFMPLLVLVAMAACDRVDWSQVPDGEGEDSTEVEVRTKNVKFKVSGLSVGTSEFSDDTEVSRATLADAQVTDLYVVDGQAVVCHQISTDSDFGSPNIALSYGQHQLAFVATKGEGVTVENGKLTMTKVKDTFGKYVTLTVSATTLQQSVSLDRAVCGLRFVVKDRTTEPISKFEVTMSHYYGGVMLPSFAGVKTENMVKTVAIADGAFNSTNDVAISFYTFSPVMGEEWSADVKVRMLKADGSVVLEHQLKDVPLLVNRMTVVSGNFFGGSVSNALSVNNTWLTEKNVSL